MKCFGILQTFMDGHVAGRRIALGWKQGGGEHIPRIYQAGKFSGKASFVGGASTDPSRIPGPRPDPCKLCQENITLCEESIDRLKAGPWVAVQGSRGGNLALMEPMTLHVAEKG